MHNDSIIFAEYKTHKNMSGAEFIGEDERKEVNEVLETGILFRYGFDQARKGMFKAQELETVAKKFTDATYAHAVSSGSTAVTTSLATAGIGLGDEVIVTPFTFVATIEAIMLLGALPVFAEVDETLCLSASGIEAVITPKTKGVCLVHMCGAAADMDAIMPIIKAHSLILVEDAGQALGAFYKGISVGLFGEVGCFSFDFFKISTAGEGGLCITNNKDTYHLMEQYTDHGHTHTGDNRGMEAHFIMGSNFRLSETNAAIGKVQMQRIETLIKLNKKNKAILKDALADIKGLTFRHLADPVGDSATFLSFFTPTTELAQELMRAFTKEGLAGFNYWYTNNYHFINQWDHIKDLKSPNKLGIHHFGAPQDYHALTLPKSNDVVGRLISLGIKSNWPEEDLSAFKDKMVAIVQNVLINTTAQSSL